MNTEERTVSNPKENSQETGISSDHSTEFIRVSFDKRFFILICGLGIILSGIGTMMIEATKKVPESASKPIVQNATRHLSLVLPESGHDIFIFIAGNLVLFSGVFCIFYGLWLIVRYVAGILRN